MEIKTIHKYGYIDIIGDDVDNNIFFISDPHFDHTNIIRLCNRPFADVDEMNQTMIDNWNKTVPKYAIVFILGDFCWSKNQIRWRKLLSELNGRKVFIKGNHDHHTVVAQCEEQFITVRERLEVRINGFRMMLDHYPMKEWSGSWHGVYSLYGHIHEKDFPGAKATQYNVSVERNDYRPISFGELSLLLTEQTRRDCGNLQLKDINNDRLK